MFKIIKFERSAKRKISYFNLLPIIFISLMFAASPAYVGTAQSTDILVQCDSSGVITTNTAITGVSLPNIQYDTSGNFYVDSVDVAIFTGSTIVKELDGYTTTNLQVALGAVTNYDYNATTPFVYEIKFRGHYSVVGASTQEITEDWQSSGQYFEAAPAKSISVGSPTGTITAGTAGSTTFAAITANIADGTAVTINWCDANGNAASAPVGLSAAGTIVTSNGSTITVTADNTAAAGTYHFTATSDGVSSGVVTVTVSQAAPVITGINQTTGPEAGGTNVTITGIGFTGLSGVASVNFGSTAATSYSVNSDTSITATSPAGSGTVDVKVTTPGSSSVTNPNDLFTYYSTSSQGNTVNDAGQNPTNGPVTVNIPPTTSDAMQSKLNLAIM